MSGSVKKTMAAGAKSPEKTVYSLELKTSTVGIMASNTEKTVESGSLKVIDLTVTPTPKKKKATLTRIVENYSISQELLIELKKFVTVEKNCIYRCDDQLTICNKLICISK